MPGRHFAHRGFRGCRCIDMARAPGALMPFTEAQGMSEECEQAAPCGAFAVLDNSRSGR